ncbi:unnamed protein product [Mytilus edulis]|uniref:CARD domain-containing protein n=1 Tax=Mytilus edulis TaxID=6550 RepID=A0A8S3SXR4_MYTED|nr:unnamed protein product [Mytilus edulis]
MAQIALDDDIPERKFTDNFTYLQKKLSRITDIVDILIEKRVINLHDRPKFLNVHKPQKEKIDDVLQEVITKKKFNEFIFALMKTGQSTVIEILTLDNTEFCAFIGSPKQEAVSTSTKTVNELETELKQQAHKVVKLEAEKKILQQDIDHLQDVQQEVRCTIEEKTSRIEMFKKNIEKNQLEKDVQQLQHDLNNSKKELEMKTKYVEKLQKLYSDAVEQRKEVFRRIEEDRKESQDKKIERKGKRIENIENREIKN